MAIQKRIADTRNGCRGARGEFDSSMDVFQVFSLVGFGSLFQLFHVVVDPSEVDPIWRHRCLLFLGSLLHNHFCLVREPLAEHLHSPPFWPGALHLKFPHSHLRLA